jgi:hypothetical protein
MEKCNVPKTVVMDPAPKCRDRVPVPTALRAAG